MIAFLRGTVVATTLTMAYIDVNGVGFGVHMSTSSLASLPPAGQEARILTYLQVREDGMQLFGFATEDERALFEKLIGVSGIGPKVALSALSALSPSSLAQAIALEDVSRVQKIPGVGKKTAQRIILELKGSIGSDLPSLFDGEVQVPSAKGGMSAGMQGAVEALLSMGFTSTEVELALKGASEDATETALLQYALKRLGN